MKKYFILAAVAATFAACSFDKDMGESSSQVQEERIPLLLGYSVSNLNAPVATTRGNVIDLQDKALMTGTTANQIGLFILKRNTTPSENNAVTRTDLSFEQWNLPSSSLSTTTPFTATGYVGINTTTTLQYPSKSQEINLFAYAPYVNNTTTGSSYIPSSWTDISTEKITFYTKEDQTTDADFMASDVLWGRQGGIVNSTNNVVSGQKYTSAKTEIHTNSSSTSQAMSTYASTYAAYYGVYDGTEANCLPVVIMPMEHKGSKIIVNVHANGIELTKLQNATVDFFVDHLQGTLTVSDGTFEALNSTDEAYVADRKVTLTTHLGIESTVTNVNDTPTLQGNVDSNNDDTDDYYTCAAVIVPQTTSSTASNDGGTSVKITLKSNNTASATASTVYKYKDTTPRTFASGKKYIYNITLTATGLQVTTTVANWDDDTSSLNGADTGNADLQ